MNKRSGPSRDAIEGRVPLPRAAATLGSELIDADGESGTIELALAERDLPQSIEHPPISLPPGQGNESYRTNCGRSVASL